MNTEIAKGIYEIVDFDGNPIVMKPIPGYNAVEVIFKDGPRMVLSYATFERWTRGNISDETMRGFLVGYRAAKSEPFNGNVNASLKD